MAGQRYFPRVTWTIILACYPCFCFVLPRKMNGGVEFVLNALPDEMALLLLRDAKFSHSPTCFSHKGFFSLSFL
jgi:hypothetical protein